MLTHYAFISIFCLNKDEKLEEMLIFLTYVLNYFRLSSQYPLHFSSLLNLLVASLLTDSTQLRVLQYPKNPLLKEWMINNIYYIICRYKSIIMFDKFRQNLLYRYLYIFLLSCKRILRI